MEACWSWATSDAASLLHPPPPVQHGSPDRIDRRLHHGNRAVLFFANLVVALFKGKKAESNPWGGVTLEWHTPSPPPLENFEENPLMKGRPYIFNPGDRTMSTARPMHILFTGLPGSQVRDVAVPVHRNPPFRRSLPPLLDLPVDVPIDFHNGGKHLNVIIGVANTVILLTSSLTVAVAITAIQKGNKKLTLACWE